MTYVRPDLVIDEEAIAQTAYDLVAERVPGWQPADTALDTALLEAPSRLAAELRGLVIDVSDLIVEGLATSVLGLPRRPATPAVVTVTFTLETAFPNYTIPAGTQLGLTAPDGSLVGFATLIEAITSTTSVTVDAEAVEPGEAGNGLTGAGVVIDAIPNLVGVTAITTSAGGAEAETEEAYLDRIVRHMLLVAEVPILPEDYALMAIDVEGVARAMAIDLYDPATNTYGHVRTVTVVLQDDAGQPVAGSIKTEVDNLLQEHREVGFVVNVIDPIYHDLTVATTIVKTPDALQDQVEADVQAALEDFLSPANWGRGTSTSDPVWVSQPVVYVNQLITVVGSVPGVLRVVSLTINGGTADVTMQSGKPHALPHLTAPPTVTFA